MYSGGLKRVLGPRGLLPDRRSHDASSRPAPVGTHDLLRGIAPVAGREQAVGDNVRTWGPMKRSSVELAAGLLLACWPCTSVAAQASGSAMTRRDVSGTVFDSISNHALRGASVQLVGAADTVLGKRFAALTDSAGRYSIRDVPAGRYVAGFHHVRLDSLGLEPEERSVTVADANVRLDLATPSPGTFVALVCPDHPRDALLVGHVRATDSQVPLADAIVSAAWSELDTTNVFTAQRSRERSIRASPSGWFALCGLPSDLTLLVHAAVGADSSGYVRHALTPASVRVATFHVGGAVRKRVVTAGEGWNDQVWGGEARLSGIVRDERGQPMANARLTVWGTGNETTTDARGRFTLGGLPGGTQTVEVRAIGFQPIEHAIVLSSADPATLDVRLRERVTELAGVNVRATAVRARLAPFYERMRDSERGINHGYFITQEEIERRKPAFLTQLFENIPTVRVLRGYHPLDDLLLSTNRCVMTVYLDNIRIVGTLGGIDDKVNRLVPPGHVAAIEIYPRSVTAPPAYQPLNGTCGVVLIWTK